MKPSTVGPAMPRPIAPRAPYGLDIGGRTNVPASPTFPSRPPAPLVEAPAAQDENAVRPPKGTDPDLWKVLTADERAFFAREEAMGPLSYGQRISTGPTIPARGGRLNLRG